jgi:hypothetical protein
MRRTGRGTTLATRALRVLLAAAVLLPAPSVSAAVVEAAGEAASAGVSATGAAGAATTVVAGPAVLAPVGAAPAPLSPTPEVAASLAVGAPSLSPVAAAAPAALRAPALAAPSAVESYGEGAPRARAAATRAAASPRRAAALETGEAAASIAGRGHEALHGANGEAAELGALFDGAKEFNPALAKVSFRTDGGKTVSVKLRELDAALSRDPSLAKSSSVKLVLPGRGSPAKGVPADLEKALTGWLRGRGVDAPVTVQRARESWAAVDLALIKNAPRILRDSWTVPNRQDYFYLGTKTFGLNLAVRAFFAASAVHSGSNPLVRAIVSTCWYQIQDALFTVFGQTYMKFIGKMTGLVRLGRSYFGDFVFTYFQLISFEFLNRLVLGPIGENPLVYSWAGIGLIFSNILMGMLAGGPLIPAINKMRRAGVISEKMMMHLYNLASLTMQFGLFATFGYQHIYFLLTTATMIVSWGVYAFFTLFYKDKPGLETGLGAPKPKDGGKP